MKNYQIKFVKSEHPLLISYVFFEYKNKNNDKNHIQIDKKGIKKDIN